MIARSFPSQCPGCGGMLEVSELHCDHCGASVRGSFSLQPFAALSHEQREFLVTFVLCRGNIKDVEKRLGISYPTVRRRLEAVIAGLESGQPTVNDVLTALEQGEISAREAATLMEHAPRPGAVTNNTE